MNFGLVARVLGNILLIEGGALTIPLGISLYFRERGAVIGILLSMGILGLTGLFLSNVPVRSPRLKAREAVAIVTLGWVIVSFFAALPLVLSGAVPSFVDALFEAVSGLTTTGATVITQVEMLPKGILLWRSLLHWLGGMGILVLTLAILPTLGVVGFQVFKAESPGPTPDKFTPRLAATSKILYTIYTALTALMVIAVRAAGVSWLDSFILAFGAVGTGGFAPFSDSLMGLSPNRVLMVVLAASMFLSGVNFALYYDLLKGRWKQVWSNSELRLYLGITAAAVLALSLNLYGRVYGTLGETLRQAWFQVSSIMTTTGYTSADFDLWPSFSKAVLFALMFVGGSAGSTSGSVKVVRLLVTAKVVKREINRVLHPQAARPVIINGRVMSSDVVQGVVSFLLLYVAVFALGSLVISLEGVDLLSAMSAVAATLGNVGVGFGAVGPTAGFVGLSSASKLFLSFLMLLGRLELFPLLAVLSPNFWRE
ncbi:MAG TPA: TrkH family potassium uptake protein [Limnochordia bacterium]|nr:TrkH family potassium uptake protein [Limnochordia bacterium]